MHTEMRTASGRRLGDIVVEATRSARVLWVIAAAGAAATGLRALSAVGVADSWLTVAVLGAYPWLVLTMVLVAAVVAVAVWTRELSQLRVPTAAVAIAAMAGVAFIVPRGVGEHRNTASCLNHGHRP